MTPPSTKGSATGVVGWARRQLGASAAKVERWNAQAPGEWCGVWLAAAMRSAGLKPPSGYPAAINWSNYGTAVKPGEEQPGDVLVYGSKHVAMYVGGGKQIQGNDINGTVGISGTGSGLGLGPITAIRRPPYKGEAKWEKEGLSSFGPLGTLEEGLTYPSVKAAELIEGAPNAAKNAASGVAGDVLSGLESLLGEKAVPIMLNIGLVGGGAFLAYFGLARMLGVGHPVQTPARALRGVGEAAAAGAA